MTPDGQKTLSVCMIVKNEEAVLGRCLRDAAFFADEIVVVDTGSADGTRKIARGFTDKVFDFVWREDFAAARNASFEKASCDYVMWLDADDRIDEENGSKIRSLKRSLCQKLVMAGYERPENGGIFLYPRIVRRDAGLVWKGAVHERLAPRDGENGPVEADIFTADFVIRHEKAGAPDYGRNIRIMERLCRQEFRQSFWFCAQCFLDCVLADEEEKAGRYLALAKDSETPFEDRLEVYALINRVLKYHKKYDAMIKWNAMYLKDRKEGKP